MSLIAAIRCSWLGTNLLSFSAIPTFYVFRTDMPHCASSIESRRLVSTFEWPTRPECCRPVGEISDASASISQISVWRELEVGAQIWVKPTLRELGAASNLPAGVAIGHPTGRGTRRSMTPDELNLKDYYSSSSGNSELNTTACPVLVHTMTRSSSSSMSKSSPRSPCQVARY